MWYPVGDGATRLGRGPENDIVVQGSDAASVSLRHLEICRDAAGFRIRDLDSTNGTYVNGERVWEADLSAPSTIRLGPEGPELAFVISPAASTDLNKTVEIPKSATPPAAGAYDKLLSEAVARARRARDIGFGDQTMSIMREALERAVRHSSRRFRLVIWVLAVGLVGVCGGAAWNVSKLRAEKRLIDQRIRQTEAELEKARGSAESDQLIARLAEYQDQARQLERNPLYRVGVREKQDFVTEEIRALMAEFGAEVYSVPPEFVERVDHYIQQYLGPDRPLVEAALRRGAPQLKTMRRLLREEQLPSDLAYIPLVESALAPAQASAAGALGPWQFTPATARAFGLRVDSRVDERLDLTKSTQAGCRYLRALILDFGSGSSVMLALAAYNLGPGRVKQAVLNTVRDPIKQRNFWYLYRMQALPAETREYVPKVVAAIIIGRNPRHFGF